MWKVSRAAKGLTFLGAMCAVGTGEAAADDNYNQNSALYGYNLPQIPVPYGSDEVRAADGTTCRSAVGGDGSFLDFGAIGTPPAGSTDESASVYARVVIPLGQKPKRLDCTSLYQLEIARLKYELELARSGLGEPGAAPQGGDPNWAETGWTTNGKKK